MNVKIITRAAFLLALTLVFQSLRIFLPVTPFFSTFIIGSLVNACLLIAVEVTGYWSAVVIAVLAPVTAYLQQLLPLPVFVLPVAAGNLLYITVFGLLRKLRWGAIISAAGAKSMLLYYSFSWLLNFVTIPPKLATGLLFVMSWPQFITAVIGGVLASLITARLLAINKHTV